MAFAFSGRHATLPRSRPLARVCHQQSLPKSTHARRSRRATWSCSAGDVNARGWVNPELEAKIRDYMDSVVPDSDGNLPSSPLAYTTLSAAGRTDLVEPIMDAGGYITVSEILEIPVEDTYSASSSFGQPRKISRVFEDRDTGAALAMGSRKEERLGVEVDIRAAPALEPPWSQSGAIYSGPEPVPTAKEVMSIKDVVVIKDNVIPEGERMVLSLGMRAGTLALVVMSSLGYGRASIGVLEDAALDALRYGSASLAVGHILLSMFAAAVLAPQFGRNSLLWGTKVLLSGPLGVIELRRLGPIEAPRK